MTEKKDLTREDVETTMANIRADGKNPSVARIRSIIGGSDSTIARFKREIEADTALPKFSEEAQQAFRVVWDKGVAHGAAQSAQALDEIRQDYDSVLEENERLEGQLAAAEMRQEKHQKQYEDLLSRLSIAQAQATEARANSEAGARQLAEALARLSELHDSFAAEGAQLRVQLADMTDKVHALELHEAGLVSENERAKAHLTTTEDQRNQLEAQFQTARDQLVEANNIVHALDLKNAGLSAQTGQMKTQLASTEEQRKHFEAQAQSASAHLAEARDANTELAHKLADAIARLAELDERYKEDVPALKKQLGSAVAKSHEAELQLARLQGQLEVGDHRPKKSAKSAAVAQADLFTPPVAE